MISSLREREVWALARTVGPDAAVYRRRNLRLEEVPASAGCAVETGKGAPLGLDPPPGLVAR